MDYPTLLGIHKLTVGISLALFLLRGAWRLADSPMNDKKWVKIVPHVNDTLLLSAAIGMLFASGMNPLEHPWIIAKITGLLAYIGIGTVALKRGRSKGLRIKAFIASLGIFAYIVAVAVNKQVIPGVL